MIPWLGRSHSFPPLQQATPDGLLAVGGDLSPARLVAAYRTGVFPWYSEGQPILWWSPDPRLVLIPSELKIARSLRKTLKKDLFQIRCDTAFGDVMRACAEPRKDHQGTWITDAMIEAYCELHHRGFAHSVEAWQDQRLVGGLYGVALGRVFFGESMFARQSDASKVAFTRLVQHLQEAQFALIDCQMRTAHLMSFGAREIPRSDFVRRLDELVNYAPAVAWPATLPNNPLGAPSTP